MSIVETVKSAQKPTNTALLKISFWIITCLIIIHVDTLSHIFSINIKDLTLTNLAGLSVFMLLSLVILKMYWFISTIVLIPLIDFIEDKELFSYKDKNIEAKKISLSDMLYYSTQTNDGNIYRHYTLLREKTEKQQKVYEFLAYMFVIISVNILFKGSVYSLLKQHITSTENVLLVIVFIVISLICGYKFCAIEIGFYHPNLKDKINKTLRGDNK